jgi:hypothetical protein
VGGGRRAPRAAPGPIAWSLAALACVASVSTAAPASASAAAHGRLARAPRCAPPRREVLGRSGPHLLFVRQTGPTDFKYGAPHALYGCISRYRAAVKLYEFEAGDLPSVVVTRFAAPYAAFFLGWQSTVCADYENAGAQDCGRMLFGSVDLRTGRVRTSVESHMPEPLPAPTELVVTPAGWIAWTAPGSSGADALFADDSSGQRTLDPGPVEGKSLAVTGATVRWSDTGVEHFSVLH